MPDLSRIKVRRLADRPSEPSWPDKCAIAAQVNVGVGEGEEVSHVGLLVRGNYPTQWYIIEAWDGRMQRSKQQVSDILASPPKSQGHCFWNGDYLLVWPELDSETFKAIKNIAGAIKSRVEREPYIVFADRQSRFEGTCFTREGELHGIKDFFYREYFKLGGR